jgi:16S rRNA (cytidine1402-2'-O)-methyltransferase
MYAALFLEKVMDHIEKMVPELHEPVRRIGHDEQLAHVIRGFFDLFRPQALVTFQRIHFLPFILFKTVDIYNTIISLEREENEKISGGWPVVNGDKNDLNAGKLFIVPTPIGNLRDITLRALEILSQVDLIACEDTRHTIKLLNHYDIRKPLISYEKFSEGRKLNQLIEKLEGGDSVALVSDGGTPLISDPGARLVSEARVRGIDVVALPGACAFITAVSGSGLDGPLRFIGFFPRRHGDADREISIIKNSSDITAFYESPRRIVSTLALFKDRIPDSMILIARELTKLHEEYLTGNPAELLARFQDCEPKGEFTVIVKASPAKSEALPDIRLKARELLSGGCSKRDAARILQDLYGMPKKDIYTMLIEEIS